MPASRVSRIRMEKYMERATPREITHQNRHRCCRPIRQPSGAVRFRTMFSGYKVELNPVKGELLSPSRLML